MPGGDGGMPVFDLDEALDEVQVMHRGQADPAAVEGWWPGNMPWAVTLSNPGVIAIFNNEKDANAFRLLLVNSMLNF